jgi:microcystin-dependent protein
VGGEEAHTLLLTEMAAHDHGGVTGGTNPAEYNEEGASVGSAESVVQVAPHTHTIASAGGDVAHNTMQPFQVTEWIIKT